MTQKAFAQGSTFPPTKPGVLRLYNMRFCPFAQRTRLVLLHKNIPHEVVNINLKSKPDWFLALNPLGQVPVLQIDDKVVPESTATCDWLDEVYPENRLQPADPYRWAWDRVLYEQIGKVITPFYVATRSSDVSELQAKVDELLKNLQFFEEKLKARGDGPYFGGSKPAMLDFLLWPFYERFPMLAPMKENPAFDIDAEKFPTLTLWAKAMKEKPEVAEIAFDPISHATWFKGHVNGAPDYDMFLKE